MDEIQRRNRPRERLVHEGAAKLSDSELLAIILQNGTAGENVLDLANRILSNDSPSELSFKELQSIRGVGPVRAVQIKAIYEFAIRARAGKKEGVQVRRAKDVFDYTAPRIAHLDKENFLILNLDSKNRIIKEETVSVGILNASIVHPREIFKCAIRNSANSIIIVHNHPSGDPTPSPEDMRITKKLISGGELVGIKVLDHVIVGEGYWSYREHR